MATNNNRSREKRDIIKPADPKQLIEDAKDPFARLFRMVMYEQGMSPERWDALMNRFLDVELHKGLEVSRRKRGTDRSNYSDAFLGETMTGKNFVNAMQFLYPITARISIHLDFPFRNLTKSILIYKREPTAAEEFVGKKYDAPRRKMTNYIELKTGGAIKMDDIDMVLYNKLKRIIDEHQGENDNDV